jgi:hypothetical protein
VLVLKFNRTTIIESNEKIILLPGFLLLISIGLFAQYSTDWIRPADNYLKSGSMIARNNADNVIVTGYIQSQNIYTRKYDKFGNFQWKQTSSSGIQSNYEKPIWVNADINNWCTFQVIEAEVGILI